MTVELASQVAAWWGAVVATLLLVWDFYKYKRSGPRLKITTRSNFDWFTNASTGRRILVRVVNAGEISVRITRIEFRLYKNRIFRFLGIYSDRYRVRDDLFTGDDKTLPQVLKPASSWAVGCTQFERFQDAAENGGLVIEVYCDQLKRPLKSKLKIIEHMTFPAQSDEILLAFYEKL